ncbi:MAG: hypothetical protein JNM95_11440 [Chitinophagaceae bacterium]|nr:hypothetical protein [Chitinophagaceae bacterium]
MQNTYVCKNQRLSFYRYLDNFSELKTVFLALGCFVSVLVNGQATWSGVYSFNKGINKDQGTLYLQQFKSDSAYFYLNFISAMPDFNMYALKGFMQIQNQEGMYQKGDSLRIQFLLQGNLLILKADSIALPERGILTKYKKNSPTVKKNSTLYIDYVEKTGLVKSDSAYLFEVPHVEGKQCGQLRPNDEVKIIDSFGAFYLIELPDRVKEFVWVQKKYIVLNKK